MMTPKDSLVPEDAQILTHAQTVIPRDNLALDPVDDQSLIPKDSLDPDLVDALSLVTWA